MLSDVAHNHHACIFREFITVNLRTQTEFQAENSGMLSVEYVKKVTECS